MLLETIQFNVLSINVRDVLKMRPANRNIDRVLQGTPSLVAQMNRDITGHGLQEKITNYILFIPLFIYLECVGQNKQLAKRKDSLLKLNINLY